MLEQLPGLPGERAVVPHVDDLCASHGANRALGLPQDWGCEGELGIFASVL